MELIEAIEKFQNIRRALNDLSIVSEEIFLTETQRVDIDNRIDILLEQEKEILTIYPDLYQLVD